jgi:adenosylhomocysteine nucleosidase
VPQRKPLILFALQFEAKMLLRRLRSGGVAGEPGAGGLGRPFASHIIGPRAAHLPDVPPDTSMIILAGLAGALDARLATGEVLIDEGSTAEIESSLPRRLIHTADELIAAPQQKHLTGTQTGAAAVDMESAIVRAWALRQNVPFLGIRAIADTAGESLDPALAELVDAGGRSRPGAAIGLLLRRPAMFSRLLHIRRTSRIALDRLSEELLTIVRAGDGSASPRRT